MSFSECVAGEKPSVTVDETGKFDIKVSDINDYSSPKGETVTQINGGIKLKNDYVLIPELSRTIAQLMKRVAALEAIINDGDIKAKSINNALIATSRSEATKLFANEKFRAAETDTDKRSIIPIITFEQNTDTTGDRAGGGRAVMEIGQYLDFHDLSTTHDASKTEKINGTSYKYTANCGKTDTTISDNCARIFVDGGHNLFLEASNGVYKRMVRGDAKEPIKNSSGEVTYKAIDNLTWCKSSIGTESQYWTSELAEDRVGVKI